MDEMRKLETEKRRDDMKKAFVRHIHEQDFFFFFRDEDRRGEKRKQESEKR